MRKHLKDNNWDVVSLTDDTVFAVNADHNKLISWSRGDASDLDLLASFSVGTIEDFAVINDKIFFIHNDIVDQVLYSIDADGTALASTREYLVDAYADWFA